MYGWEGEVRSQNNNVLGYQYIFLLKHFLGLAFSQFHLPVEEEDFSTERASATVVVL